MTSDIIVPTVFRLLAAGIGDGLIN